jgi:tetrahydromethanopterin S-methyltransferase subunit G
LRFATIQCVEGKQDLADLAPKDSFIPAEKAHMGHFAQQACGSRLGLDLGILLGDVIGRLAWLRPQTHFIGSAVAKSARGFLQTSSNGV